MESEEAKKKVEELQVLESYLQNFLLQRQSINFEINEITNALDELKNAGEEVYKISSGIMFKSDKNKLKIELEEKRKILDIKISSIEKQEKLLEKNSTDLKEEINKFISRDDNNEHNYIK